MNLPKEYVAAWSKAVESESIRFLKFDIDIDALEFRLVETGVSPRSNVDFKDQKQSIIEFEQLKSHVEKDRPCLIAFKMEPQWVLLSWMPEDSQVRQKMIFASARSALKQQLSSSRFGNDIQSSILSEISLDVYFTQNSESSREETLTLGERIANEVTKDSFPTELKAEGMKMLDLKTDESFILGFAAIREKKKNCVFFYVDGAGERLSAGAAFDFKSLDEIKAQLYPETPCYVIFRWDHYIDGDKSNGKDSRAIFLYFCSDDAPPKKKMIASTVSKNIWAACEGLKINAKRLQISEAKELSEEELYNALYPKAAVKESFGKPKGPQRRGPAKVKKFEI